jgi:thiol-disulfide isomerase/thioredoxin
VQTIGIEQFDELKDANIGKVLVLNVFASWCPPCEEETPSFVQMYDKYAANAKFELIGLSIDESKAELEAFLQKHKVNYPIYQITPAIQRRLMANKVPTTIIYAPNGMYQTSILGAVDGEELYQFVETLAPSSALE